MERLSRGRAQRIASSRAKWNENGLTMLPRGLPNRSKIAPRSPESANESGHLFCFFFSPLGRLLGLSWGAPGGAWGGLGASWAAPGGAWGALGGHGLRLGGSWAVPGPLLAALGPLLELSWRRLGRSWGLLGASWPALGRLWASKCLRACVFTCLLASAQVAPSAKLPKHPGTGTLFLYRCMYVLAWTRAFHARSKVGLGSAASSKLA